MAYLLDVAIVDPGDHTIKVVHQFYGETEEEVRTYYREHLGSCEYFRSADKNGRAIEALEEIPDEELPEPEDYEFEEYDG